MPDRYLENPNKTLIFVFDIGISLLYDCGIIVQAHLYWLGSCQVGVIYCVFISLCGSGSVARILEFAYSDKQISSKSVYFYCSGFQNGLIFLISYSFLSNIRIFNTNISPCKYEKRWSLVII